MSGLTTDGRFTVGCPHKVAMDRDPTQDRARKLAPSAEAQSRRDEGIAFGRALEAEIAAAYGVDDLATVASAEERIARTMDAIRRKEAVVVGGRLPRCGEREGSPDLLVLVADGTYIPGDVKNHRGYKRTDAAKSKIRRTAALLDQLAKPGAPEIGVSDIDKGDLAQLCHYWVMLSSLDLTAGDPRGIIVNNERIALWWGLTDAMTSYAREYESRLQSVTQVLAGNTGASHAILHDECEECEWRTVCAERVERAEHFSLVGTTLKRARELEKMGILTLDQLARADAQSLKSRGFTVEVATDLVDRARLRVRGELRPHRPRTGYPRPVPRATLEVDFDAEWVNVQGRPGDSHVYLWGTLTTRTDSDEAPQYRAFHSLAGDVYDDSGPLAEFWAWANTLRRAVADDPARLRFYGYSVGSAEKQKMLNVVRRHPENSSLPSSTEIEEFFSSPLVVDLETDVDSYVWPTRNNGLKTIAPLVGATWRTVGAGGDWSMRMVREVVTAPDATVRADRVGLLLEYNEDDVRATKALREYLSRAQADRSIPDISSLDQYFA
jgi:predicted RecB family nuclease